MKIFLCCILLLLSSCTYSVILNHTQGQATDLIDENQTPTADIRPNIAVPLK